MNQIQINALGRMDAGEFLVEHRYGELGDHIEYFFLSDKMFVAPQTVGALRRRGWIENYEAPDRRWRGGKYRITEAGRKALAKGAKP